MPFSLSKLKRGFVPWLIRFAKRFGYVVEISKVSQFYPEREKMLNLNIGAGNYVIGGFVSLDYFSEHYYGDRAAFDRDRISYDIRSDLLPFDDGAVDNIYLNHVIEHIETPHIERLFSEALRVLKPGGVMRIGCPDAEFLFQVSTFENDYWKHRRGWFHKNLQKGAGIPTKEDAFVSQVATPRLDGYVHGLPEKMVTLDTLDPEKYADTLSFLRDGLEFRSEHPNDHINNWDFDRIRDLGLRTGFRHAVRSKPNGSVSRIMQARDFDRNHHHMSLYVDLVK